jgi:hypothetical protein
VRLPRIVTAPLLAAGLALPVALPAAAGELPTTSATPAAGVATYNASLCGTNWVDIHIPNNSYYNVYNDDFGRNTCVTAEREHLDFQVTYAQNNTGFKAYPNISSGWEANRYTCTGRSGACFTYPVQQKNDGAPLTSIAGWLAPGRYDFSYDTWFNKTDAHPLQDNGTEVMIWLAHPGVPEACDRKVSISGIEWCVTGWTTNHPGEPSWNLVIYYAVTPRSSASGLWLNEFFRDAIAHGKLSANWWLTGIDAGFELVQGGVHDNIHSYSLTNLPAKAN